MWLFLPFGFFSIVAHARDHDHLIVRARARDDLEEFARRALALRHKLIGHAVDDRIMTIRETADHDYPFRLLITRGELAVFMADYVEHELQQTNFKASVYKHAGVQREALYTRVWHLLRMGFQAERPKVKEEKRSVR